MKSKMNQILVSSPENPIEKAESLVSVLILTFNSNIYIRRCLDSVFIQNYLPYEVIVIDGGSSDGTLKILEEYSPKYLNFHYFVYPNTSIGRARNLGMQHVRGNFILFLDSDCVLPFPNWISEMIAGFNSDKIAGVFTFGKYSLQDPSILRYSILSNPYRRTIQDQFIGYHNYIPIGTGHIIIRRQLIDDVGGFKDLIAAEDIEITNNIIHLGYLFRYMPGLEVFHYHVTSLTQLINKNRRNISGGMNSQIWKKTYLSPGNLDIFLSLTIIYPLLYSLYRTLTDKDWAWLWHPFVTIFKILSAISILSKKYIHSG